MPRRGSDRETRAKDRLVFEALTNHVVHQVAHPFQLSGSAFECSCGATGAAIASWNYEVIAREHVAQMVVDSLAVTERTGLVVDSEHKPLDKEEIMNDLQEQAYRHVLWTVGNSHGYEPGGFTRKLLEAWAHADYSNDAKLCAAFPELGEAIATLKYTGPESLVAALKEET